MSKEAMKLALEALENSRSLEPVDVQWVKGKRHAAITALREALAEQPAQQEFICSTGLCHYKAQQQEPVAWDNCRSEKQCRSWCGNSACASHWNDTSPPNVPPARASKPLAYMVKAREY